MELDDKARLIRAFDRLRTVTMCYPDCCEGCPHTISLQECLNDFMKDDWKDGWDRDALKA